MIHNDLTNETEADLEAREPWENANLSREICEQMLNLTRKVAGTIRRRVRKASESTPIQDPQFKSDPSIPARPVSEERDDSSDRPYHSERA